ncbi:response regulator [Roseomonas sp. WA12]
MPCDLLVVDDDELVLDVTVEALQDADYEVRMADDVAVAVAYLDSRDAWQLVLTDINLGAPINGFAVVERARLTRPSLKAIYYSGLPSNWHNHVFRGTHPPRAACFEG